jgi:hypothetical protein
LINQSGMEFNFHILFIGIVPYGPQDC